MNNAIEIKVQIVQFFAIGVWFRGIDRDLNTLDILRQFFNYRGNNLEMQLAFGRSTYEDAHLWILLGKPSK